MHSAAAWQVQQGRVGRSRALQGIAGHGRALVLAACPHPAGKHHMPCACLGRAYAQHCNQLLHGSSLRDAAMLQEWLRVGPA